MLLGGKANTLPWESWITMENEETTPNVSFGAGNFSLSYLYVKLLKGGWKQKIFPLRTSGKSAAAHNHKACLALIKNPSYFPVNFQHYYLKQLRETIIFFICALYSTMVHNPKQASLSFDHFSPSILVTCGGR